VFHPPTSRNARTSGGDLDDKDLVDTHRWKTIESASRYAQTVVHEAARAADLLPAPAEIAQIPKGGKTAEKAQFSSKPLILLM